MIKHPFFMIIVSLMLSVVSVAQEDSSLPDCPQRPTISGNFQVEPNLYCLEQIAQSADGETGNYTSLIFDNAHRLYATNPLKGEVVVLSDEDSEDFGLVDTEAVLVSGLSFPHGLAYDETTNVLYILGNGVVYTHDISTNLTEILVDDLPPNRTFASRAILVHDEFLYVGIPAPCDLCISYEDDTLRGTIVRMRLDGTEQTVVAQGLRYPTGLTIYDNHLLITDVAADHHTPERYADEINRIPLAEIGIIRPHFGFPHCYASNVADDLVNTDFDCARAIPPSYLLPANTTPFGIAVYQGDAFEWLQSAFLVALLDSDVGQFRGNAIIGITPTGDDTVTYDAIAPSNIATAKRISRRNMDRLAILPMHTQRVNRTTLGIFPQAVYSVVVDRHGWIYLSTSFEGIYVIRPRTHSNATEARCRLGLYCD